MRRRKITENSCRPRWLIDGVLWMPFGRVPDHEKTPLFTALGALWGSRSATDAYVGGVGFSALFSTLGDAKKSRNLRGLKHILARISRPHWNLVFEGV